MKKFVAIMLALTMMLGLIPSLAEETDQITGWVSHVSNFDLFPFPVLSTIEAEAGVKVDWTPYERRDWISRKANILSSEELPDVMIGCTLDNMDVRNGLFLDLNDYMDLMPNVKAFFDAVPDARAMATDENGAIYAIPNCVALRCQSGDVLYVNKEWCDTLGIALPETTEDYYNMLVRFRDEDPNGNGQQDEIGFTSYGMLAGTSDYLVTAGYLAWVFPAFGVVTNHSDTYCMVKDGVPEFQPMTDNYRAALEYLAKLYAENLIDHEFFSMGFAEAAAKFQSDPLTVGSGAGWTPQTFCGDKADSYVAIAPLTGPNGDKYWNASDYFYKMTANIAAIPASSKNPEAAARFINACYDQWNGLQLTYGSEGVSFTRDEQGNPVLMDPPEGYTADNWTMINGLVVGAPTWCSAEYEASIVGESSLKIKAEYDQFYAPYFLESSKMPYLAFDAMTQEELAILRTDINSYIQQSLAQFIVNGVTDESWNVYLDTLKRMNVDRLIEIYTTAYNKTVN